MIVRRIEVEHFLGHTQTAVTFPEQGIVMLSGPSGAGKSSLIGDAVAFALFGSTATRAKRQDDLRNNAAASDAFRVFVAFENPDGTRFEVTRGINDQGRSYANCVDSKGGFAEGAEPVRARLRELIGTLNAETYHRSFVARQNELEGLADLRGADRRKFVHSMLGIDALDRMNGILRSRINSEQALIEHLEAAVAGHEDGAEEARTRGLRLAALQHERTPIADQQTATQTDADTLASQLEPLRTRLRAADALRSALATVEARIPELEQRCQLAEREAGEFVEQTALADSEQDVIARGTALRTELATLDERLALAKRRTALEERIAHMTNELVSAQETVDTVRVPDLPSPTAAELARELEQIAARGSAIRDRLNVLTEQLGVLQAGHCDSCGRGLEADEQTQMEARVGIEQAELEAERAELRDRHGVVSEALAEAETTEQTRSVASSRRERAETTLSVRRDELQLVEQELNDLPDDGGDVVALGDQREALEAQLFAARDALGEVKAAQRWLEQHPDAPSVHAGILEELASARADHQRFGSELAADPITHDEVETLHQQHQTTLSTLDALRTALSELDGQIVEIELEQTRADQAAEAHEKELEALEQARVRVKNAQRLGELVGGFRSQLAAELRPRLEEICSQIMNLLSDGRHQAIQVDEDFELLIRTGEDTWLPLRMVSGGEKARAALALRVALSRLVTQRTGTPMRFLVLDEVFGSQDPDHRERIVSVLRALQTVYPQVFLISHVGDLAQAGIVDYTVEVERDRGELELLAL